MFHELRLVRWQWRLKSLSRHHYRERGKHIGRQGWSYVSHLCCQPMGTYLEGEKKASIDENMEHEEGTYLWIMTRSKLHSDDRQRDFQVEWQTIVQMDGAVFQV